MKKKMIVAIARMLLLATLLTWCAGFKSDVNSLNGSITGNTYECQFFSNHGQKFMTMTGQKIDINENVVRERIYTDRGWGYTKTLSSVITVTVDGSEVESCGTTILFIEDGLTPDVDFTMQDITSVAQGILDNTILANTVNRYINWFGKSRVVVIQSQMGDPIMAFSGDEVYYTVCEDLPKTTKLMIDGHALYIHRANFQIIDKDLLT